jgi:hypothetical protein
VRATSQLSFADETANSLRLYETHKAEHYSHMNGQLNEWITSLTSTHNDCEIIRQQQYEEKFAEVNHLKAEEEKLLQQLKVVQEKLAEESENFEDFCNAVQKQRIQEKSKILNLTNEKEHCVQLMTTAVANVDILSKFEGFVKTFAYFGEKNSKLSRSIRNFVPWLQQSSFLSNSSPDQSPRGKKARPFTVKLKGAVDNSINVSEMALVNHICYTRAIYEALRVSYTLTSQCSYVNDYLEESPTQTVHPHPFRNRELHVAALDEIKTLMSSCDVYSDQPHRPSLASSSVQSTLVLCDPRTISHLVPNTMPERSLRIIKIMAKILSLPSAVSSREVSHHSSTQKEGTSFGYRPADSITSLGNNFNMNRVIHCLCDDNDTPPSGFWEAVALTHSDDYLNYLHDKCSATVDSDTSKSLVPVKEMIVEIDSDEEMVEFDKTDLMDGNKSSLLQYSPL